MFIQIMDPIVETQKFNLIFPFILIPIILVFIIFKFVSPLKPSLPPGPYPWPILGNIFHMGKKPHINLTHFSKLYGPIISLKLGTQVLIVGSSPEFASETLKTHDRILSGRYVSHTMPFKNPELNKLSLAWSFECDNNWKHLRSVCHTELFSKKKLESQAYLRENKVSEMVNFLEKMEGNVVKIVEIVFSTVFNMLSIVLISKEFIKIDDDDGGEMKSLIREMMKLAMTPNLADFYWMFSGFDVQNLNERFGNLVNKFHSTWKIIVEERRRRKTNKSPSECDFLDVMIQNGFGDDQINELISELFTAGTDTTTSTIEWAMAELIRNPESMTKVRDELTKELNHKNQQIIQESNIPNLHYLQACVKETLRLHPPVPFLLPHRAIESCKIMNYTIPKNSQIMINVWAIGRDPLIWEDPLLFKPERFLHSDLDFKGHNFEFVPFGAGRRICPGLPMAAKLVPLVLASLIHSFDWSLPNGADSKEIDMSDTFGVTLQKEKPLLLVPHLRK